MSKKVVTTSRFNSDVQLKLREPNSSGCPAELIIRVGLQGIRGVEILADESDTQGQLIQLWNAVRHALETEMARTL